MIIMAIKAIAFVAFFGVTFRLINPDTQMKDEIKHQMTSSKDKIKEETSLTEKKS